MFFCQAKINRQLRQEPKLPRQQPSQLPEGNKDDLLTVDAQFKILKKVHYFVIQFSKTSTIHGLTYLAQRGFHIIER